MEVEHGEGDAASSAAAGPTRDDAFSLYHRLAHDDTPMVRRAACLAFADVATGLAGGVIESSGSDSNSSAGSGRMEEDEPKAAASSSSSASNSSAAAAAAAGGKSGGDGYNVDTGDVSNSAVPPPVPPAVRVSAASAAAGDAAARQLLPLLLEPFSSDDQDSVRLLAIENCTAFARVFSQPENQRDILPLVKACAGDKSWRVRNNVAKEFTAVRGCDERATTGCRASGKRSVRAQQTRSS